MKHLGGTLRKTRSTFVRAFCGAHARIQAVEKSVDKLDRRLAEFEARIAKLEGRQPQGIHSMELNEQHRKVDEQVRSSVLTDEELRSELEGKYGISQWASKVIDEIMEIRAQAHKIRFSNDQD